jgi:hypothetical protein
MSLDTTTALGTNAPDELVPSRYAVQVGDIEVLVISDGVLPITAKTMATNADATEYGRWLDDRFLPRDVLDWPLNVVVVRSGDRTILVDAPGALVSVPAATPPDTASSEWPPEATG